MISGKWKPIIIWRLRLGKQQRSKLNRDIQGINQKMLIQHLSELVECGIANKIIHEGYPLKVEYYLTNTGCNFLEGLKIFQEIGQDYLNKDCNGVVIVDKEPPDFSKKNGGSLAI